MFTELTLHFSPLYCYLPDSQGISHEHNCSFKVCCKSTLQYTSVRAQHQIYVLNKHKLKHWALSRDAGSHTQYTPESKQYISGSELALCLVTF